MCAKYARVSRIVARASCGEKSSVNEPARAPVAADAGGNDPTDRCPSLRSVELTRASAFAGRRSTR